MIRLRSRIRRIDRGREKFGNLLSSVIASKSFVKVGLLGDKKAKRPAGVLTNVQLGIIHEFGTSRVPARPFISGAFKKHRGEYATLLRDLVERLVRTGQRSYLDTLNMLGLRASADFKNFVTTGSQIPPPNAEATLRRKMRRDDEIWRAKATKKGAVREGPAMAPRTLVDTGRMVGAITHAVVPRDASGRPIPVPGKPINAAQIRKAFSRLFRRGGA